jgi:hypothetical protein
MRCQRRLLFCLNNGRRVVPVRSRVTVLPSPAEPKASPARLSLSCNRALIHQPPRMTTRYWTTCETRVAKLGSWVYKKDDEVQPSAFQFSVSQIDTRCTTNAASRMAVWGSGHTLEACQDACKDVADCNLVTHNSKGFCRYDQHDSRLAHGANMAYQCMVIAHCI